MERLNKTLLDEFYSLAFRKKRYGSIEELQVGLNGFMDYYNYRRTHQGYKLKENGYNTPAEAHLSRPINDGLDLSKSLKKDLKRELVSNKIKAVSTKDGKKVGERTNLGDDFIKRGSEKEEVLVCQIVTTS